MRLGWISIALLCGLLQPQEEPEQNNRFTADQLAQTASSIGTLAFETRFTDRVLEIEGQALAKEMADGRLTLQLLRAAGPQSYEVVCASTEAESLQAAAVLASGQTVKVRGSIDAEALARHQVLISPCVLLTNSVAVSPTAVLAAPEALKITQEGPPTGRYRCVDPATNTFAFNFSITARRRYAPTAGAPGSFVYDPKRKELVFVTGAFAKGRAAFDVSHQGRILTLHGTGADRRCTWQGQ